MAVDVKGKESVEKRTWVLVYGHALGCVLSTSCNRRETCISRIFRLQLLTSWAPNTDKILQQFARYFGPRVKCHLGRSQDDL